MRPSRAGSSPAQRISVRTAASASSRLGRGWGSASSASRRRSTSASRARADKALTTASIKLSRRAGRTAFAPALPITIYHSGRVFQPAAPADLFMLNDIYNKRILELAADIPRLGRLKEPQGSATAHSKLCGSTVTVDLALSDGRVSDFAHDVKACALGQASSSIMARNVIGSTPEELQELRESVRKMLKENGAPPAGRWADIAVLEPVRDYKARHASTMLTFDAVVSAIEQIEGKRRTAAAAAAQ